MDKKKFEQKMKTFFDDAGVNFLKKGEYYKGGEEVANYVILDGKRKSFYLAETDCILSKINQEIIDVADYWSKKHNISEMLVKTFLRLGRANSLFNKDFTIKGKDLTNLTRKCAFIISEGNSDKMTDLLKKYSITFQAVPFKSEFLVLFIDQNNSKKISDLCYKMKDELINGSGEKVIDERSLEDEETKDIDVGDEKEKPSMNFKEEKNIEKTIDKGPNFQKKLSDIKLIDSEQNKEIYENKKNDIDKTCNFKNVEKVIQTLPVKEIYENKKNDIDKTCNFTNVEKVVQTLPVAVKEDSKTPLSLEELALQSCLLGTDSSNNLKASPNSININDTNNYEDNHSHEEYKSKDDKKAGSEEDFYEKNGIDSFEYKFYKVIKNIVGIIFFLPVYIINKLTFKKVPPFIIYWVSAIIIFFGLYQLILSFFGNHFYGSVLTSAKSTAVYVSGLLNSSKDALSLETSSGNVMSTALVYFTGEIFLMDFVKHAFILRYLLAFSLFLMIFPFTRKLGAKLNIFFILLYCFSPVIIFFQTSIIKGAVGGSLDMVKLALSYKNTSLIFGTVSSAIAFAVYFLPIVAVVVFYVASYYISPYRNKNRNYEVLP